MAKDNGGIIGILNTPTQSVATGVWALEVQFNARVSNIWPKIPYSIEIEDRDILKEKIDGKKDKLKKIEYSFIWLYAEAKTDEERNDLVERFKEKFGGK